MNEVVETVFCASLIFDWNIWPRHSVGTLDSTNVTRMVDAIRAGVKLPPIIVDRKTKRIVDGFHRTKAYEQLYGANAKIDVVFRDYKDEASIFIEATRLNAAQGLPLSPMDKAHTLLVAKDLGIAVPLIAQALGIDEERANEFLAKRSVMCNDGKRRPVSAGASMLATQLNKDGEIPDKMQEQFLLHTNGMFPMRNARLVLNALKAKNSFKLNKEAKQLLKELWVELGKLLDTVSTDDE